MVARHDMLGVARADSGSLMRILLIEDDDDDDLLTRHIIAEIDIREQIEIERKATYEEGLEALRSGDFHVCLLDYRLGARDGLELLREAIGVGCRIPIILFTGESSREIDQQAMGAGAADFLVKGEISPVLLERSIRHALERKRAQEARDEILRIVAHDLRSPLTAIKMVVEVIERQLREGKDVAQMSKHIDVQKRAITRMNRLIEDILDVARIEAGKLALDFERFSPNVLVSEAIEQHRVQAREKSIRLESCISEDLPVIEVDVDRVQQVFSNLLSNALKFTEPGGSIELGVLCRDDGLCFSVTDSGPGIPARNLPHLFDRFWQADEVARHGAGLGLAIARGIVEAHGGRIWVESELGNGAVFYFVLPERRQ